MLMSPGSSFTGNSGFTYLSASGHQEVGQADVRQALINGWIQTTTPTSQFVGSTPRWGKVASFLAADFAAAALSNSIPCFLLLPSQMFHGVQIKHSASFAGPSITAYTVSVGVSGSNAKYASAFDVFQAPGARAYQLSQNFSGEDRTAPTLITATATSVGANLNVATTGSVDIWALLADLPS